MNTLLLLAAAFAGQDRLTYITLDSAAEQRPMTYGVYEPPGWDHASPLPLVVFLHGGGDDERALDDHPVVTRTLDRMISEGRLPPVLVAVPDGERGFWRNWADGSHRFADWVMDEVLPDVRQRYPVQADNLHLMGISMGGAGTMYLGLDHLDTFASLTVLSAPLFDGDTTLRFLESDFMERFAPMSRIFGSPDPDEVRARNAWSRLSSAEALGDTILYVGAGTVDLGRIGPLTRDFHAHLVENGVPHHYHSFPGGHRWVDWARVFPVSLCYALQGDACDPGPVRGRLELSTSR